MKIADQKVVSGLATFSAGYIKRWLENHIYDKIFETGVGKKLKSLGTRERYAIEAGLNLLTVFFDQKLSAESAIKKLVKQVGTDIAPELSSRLVGDAKDRIKQAASAPEEKELAKVLAELDDQVLADLLKWLENASPVEKEKVLELFKGLSGEEVARLAKLPPALLKELLGLLEERGSSGKEGSATEAINRFNDRWERWLGAKKEGK